jgi:TetR/AcrR family transcriptional regulator, ethionamide resistance regulator
MALEPKTDAAPSRRARQGRGRRPVRASGDDRERAILENAERLLEERPLSEVSVDDLARGAGISRPSFYFYFPSKDAVVMTIIERFVPAAAASREETLKMVAEDPRAGIRQAIGDIYAAFRDRPGVATAGAELRATNEEARGIWAEIMEGWVAETTAIIEFERARGAVPPGIPARDLATALVQMNERVQHATFIGESPALDEDRVIDVCVDIWLRAIYGTADQP